MIRSFLILSFRLQCHRCFNFLPPPELFLFLFLGFCSVAPLHCLFKVKRLELDVTLTWCSKEMASQTPRVLPALAHKQWAIVVIYFLKRRGRDPSYSKNDYSREKDTCIWWPLPVWLLVTGRKMCSHWSSRSVHICAGGLCIAVDYRYWPCTWEEQNICSILYINTCPLR